MLTPTLTMLPLTLTLPLTKAAERAAKEREGSILKLEEQACM
jgi:hypothetical protein